ncbi:MAG: desulfoferrodoxin family protein [Halothiobacillus sp.]|jgi:superoxide reductase|uniref:desulfoferrodoxin family protein n=1 Tax=Halothiobacillus sp. TaxID=1891311 RepID=UPI002AD21490|nr:desulfoferrodoxin family protein [Halothiobacillus sp.]MDA3876347.1 desulfoferrodoxin family protein [Halothiobacillus sp.]
MNRRDFMSTAAISTAALAVTSQTAQAAPPRFENVVFDAKRPGHWKDVEALHVPIVAIKEGKLIIRTPHPMSEAHYIVSHSVVLKGGEFLGRTTFTWKDQPISEHALPAGYKGIIIVTSTCNLHDFWVKEERV